MSILYQFNFKKRSYDRNMQKMLGGEDALMKIYVCHECEIFALAINMEKQDAICMCGLLMEEE